MKRLEYSELLTLGQAIRIIARPCDEWAREHRQEVCERLLKIMQGETEEE